MTQETCEWLSPPGRPALGYAEVHVWRARLNQDGQALAALRSHLMAEELERAARFHFQRDRDRYVAARGVLRVILGLYLGEEPAQVGISYGPHGKPALAVPGGANQLHFNLAHSEDLALYALARSGAVGIDVEHERTDFSVAEIASSFFSPDEAAALDGLDGPRKTATFFEYWTLKEAYMKATGVGLLLPTQSFTVSPGRGGEGAATLSVHGNEEEGGRWSLLGFRACRNYAAALAFEGSLGEVLYYDWPAHS